MRLLGAHMSIAGGYFRAVESAKKCGCQCVQLFTKNNNQWRAKDITEDDAARFQASLTEHSIAHPLSHTSYLINLAAADRLLWKKSIDALVVELQRAERLRISHVVTHPGAYTTGTEAGGLRRIVQSLNEVHRQTRGLQVRCLLETTAGQGTCLGWRFAHLATILDRVQSPERLGVCLDTCHLFAAGYPLAPLKDYRRTMRELDTTIGLAQVRAIHLNDSKRELGSRVDRHEHIGRGRLGLDAFRNLLTDRRLVNIPMYIETPKGQENGVELDIINLTTLRGLIEE